MASLLAEIAMAGMLRCVAAYLYFVRFHRYTYALSVNVTYAAPAVPDSVQTKGPRFVP
jgi:hypothetical protein